MTDGAEPPRRYFRFQRPAHLVWPAAFSQQT